MNRRKALQKAGLIAGTAVTMPTLFSLLQSCQSQPRLDWQPEFFNVDEALLISSLIDTILPRTETPGGLDVKADMFIDKVISKTFDQEGQQNIRAQMTAFNSECQKAHGDNFVNLKDEDKVAVLQSAETKSGKYNGSVWGTAVGKQEPVGFYRSMKSMAIWAYFTSEEMGEKVLSYDPIPAGYEGCKPVTEVGNRWSL